MKLTFLLILVISFTEAFSQAKNETISKGAEKPAPLHLKPGKKVWMMTYFRQRYPTRIEIDAKGNTVEVPLPDPMQVEKLHIALSTDGRHWTPLNDNKPLWEQQMRDPYVRRGPDGLWRVLATGGGRGADREKVGPSCLYATSKDLVHWQVEKSLPLMKDTRNEAGALARNIWAPEWFYDDATQEYVLIWSSSFEDAGWKKSRLWSSRTKDWKTFTPAKVFFAPPYSVIDGTILKDKGTYYLYHKEEEFGAKTGERRSIRVATSQNLEGPYRLIEGPLNKGQIVPVITEGPTVMKDPVKPGWLLLYDYCMTNRFGVSTSPDLIHWQVEKEISFPSEGRHACVSQLTPEEANTLLETYSGKN